MNIEKWKTYRNRAVGVAAVVGGVAIAVLVHKNHNLKVKVSDLKATTKFLEDEVELSDKIAWGYHDVALVALQHFNAEKADVEAIATKARLPTKYV